MTASRRATWPRQTAPAHDRRPGDDTPAVVRTALFGCALYGVTEHERSLGTGAVMRLYELVDALTAERDALRDENARLRRALLA